MADGGRGFGIKANLNKQIEEAKKAFDEFLKQINQETINSNIGIKINVGGLDELSKKFKTVIKEIKEYADKNPITVTFDNKLVNDTVRAITNAQEKLKEMGANQLSAQLLASMDTGNNKGGIIRQSITTDDIKQTRTLVQVTKDYEGIVRETTKTWDVNNNLIKDTTKVLSDFEKIDKARVDNAKEENKIRSAMQQQEQGKPANNEYDERLKKEQEWTELFERNAILREQAEDKARDKVVEQLTKEAELEQEMVQKYLADLDKKQQVEWDANNKIFNQKMEQQHEWEVQIERNSILREQAEEEQTRKLEAELKKQNDAKEKASKKELERINRKDDIMKAKRSDYLFKADILDKNGILPRANIEGFKSIVTSLNANSKFIDIQNIKEQYKKLTMLEQQYRERLSKANQEAKKDQSEMYEDAIRLLKEKYRLEKELLKEKTELQKTNHEVEKASIESRLEDKYIGLNSENTRKFDKEKEFQERRLAEERLAVTAKKNAEEEKKRLNETLTSLKRIYELRTELIKANKQETSEIEKQLKLERDKYKTLELSLTNESKKVIGNERVRLDNKLRISELKGFGGEFRNAMNQMGMWIGLAEVVMVTFSKLREGASFVARLNKDLTEIGIVTGRNQEQIKGLAKEYNNLAQQLKVTTEEVAKASVEFYRQGLNEEQVKERLQQTTQYAKIANMDFKESAEILTATVNTMGVSIEKASDTFAWLGDSTATGADEIGRAFQRVGGSARALDVDFDKVSSWIAVLSSKTRESSEVIGRFCRLA